MGGRQNRGSAVVLLVVQDSFGSRTKRLVCTGGAAETATKLFLCSRSTLLFLYYCLFLRFSCEFAAVRRLECLRHKPVINCSYTLWAAQQPVSLENVRETKCDYK